MATLGGVTIPAPVTTATAFPLKPDYPYSLAVEPPVFVHRFGPIDAKIEQVFTAGNGQRRYSFRKAALSPVERVAFINFWIACGGAQTEFPFARPNSDGSTTTVTCRFANDKLTLDAALGSICSAGLQLVEVTDPATAPVYAISATVTRGPVDGSLADALLGPTQTLIPLVVVTPLGWQTKAWGTAPTVSAPALSGDVSLTITGTGADGALAAGMQFTLGSTTYTVGVISANTGHAATFAISPALTASAVVGAPLTPLYPGVQVSNRLVTVGGVVYQPRLLDWDGIQQSIGGGADLASFVFGNADRVFTAIANQVDLRKADVSFSLFHANTLTKIDLWRGHIKTYKVTARAEFPISCVDGLYELTLPFPPRKITRTCSKAFNNAENGCPWASFSGTGNPASCDKGFDTANGCHSHAMDGFFGGILAQPQTVSILDNSTGVLGFGRDHINSTSQIGETVYDQVVPEIYINWLVNNADQSTDPTRESTVNDPNDAEKGFPVEAKIIAGREESDFYAAIGIVGEGPLGFPSVTENVSQYFLDNAPPHGWPKSHNIVRYGDGRAWGVLGLRRGSGHDPVQNNDIDGGSDQFSVSAGGSGAQTYDNIKAAGTAFVEIRKSDTPGIQPSTVESHTMQVPVRYGLPGWVWTAPGARAASGPLNNMVWIAVNAYLRGRGLKFAPAAVQELYFDVDAAVAAAVLCDTIVPKLLGVGFAKQFRFTGLMQEEKPLRQWLQEILNNGLGFFTFSFGKLQIGLRINSSAVESFTIGNILWNSLVLEPIETAFNNLTINFSDEEFGFGGNAVNIYNEDHATLAGGAGKGRPQYTQGRFSLAGVTTKDQAGRLASVRICEEVGGSTADQFAAARQVSFQTTALALNVTPGMVCSLSTPDCPDYPAQQTTADGVTPPTPNFIEFRVRAWKLNKDFSVTISGQTTCWDMYDVTVGPKPSDVVADPVPSLSSRAPAGFTYRARSPQDGTLTLDQFACTTYAASVVAAHFDVFYCPEDAQTEMFSPSGFLAADLAIDYGTYGTLPVVGEWLTCEGEVMEVTGVTPVDDFHGTVNLLRGQCGTTAANHSHVASTFTSHNAAWLAEWTVPTGLDIHPGDGFVVGTDGSGEEAVVAEYDSATGLLRLTLPLATAADGGPFLVVPRLRRVIRRQHTVAIPPRFFTSAANATFADKLVLPYAGAVAIGGTLENLGGKISTPVFVQAISEEIMIVSADPPVFPWCMRTGGTGRFAFTSGAIPLGTTPEAFETALLAEAQPFERAWAAVDHGTPGVGPLAPPAVPPDPVPSAPVFGGSVEVTHIVSGWETVTLSIAGISSTWGAERDLITPAFSTAQIATSMAARWDEDPLGGYYLCEAVGSVVRVTDTSGRGGPMTAALVAVSPYDGSTGALTITVVPLAPPLGVFAGRRYAFAFTGAGLRSELSQATGSTGPTTAASAVSLTNLPVSDDPRVTHLEIYAAEDGQGLGGAANWHLVATLAAGVAGYSDTTTETALEALAVYGGPVQPASTGDLLVTVTRDGFDWLQMRIPPGGSKSNVIHGFAMFSVSPGISLNVDLINGLGSTPALQAVIE